jgi:hypothetical protein
MIWDGSTKFILSLAEGLTTGFGWPEFIEGTTGFRFRPKELEVKR